MADRVVTYVFRGNVTGLRASLASAAAGVSDLGGKLDATDARNARFHRGLGVMGRVARTAGLGLAGGFAYAVKVAADFEQSMSKVQAATHETASNMKLLRAAAIDAGAKTAFSAVEAAAGIENLAKAGVSTKAILGGGLRGALDLAAAGELGVGEAAEIAATAMTQFNLKGSKVPHIADLLAAGAGKAQGEVSDLGQALNQSGLVAGQMGLSIEETTGTLASFASAGLIGSDAGTSLKTMLLRLANPSKEASRTMGEFGINAYDAAGNLRPMAEIAGQLQTGFKGQSQATRDAALATIFGSDAIRAANVLYKQGAKGIDGWTKKVDDQGYAAETAAIKMDNLKGDLEKLSGSFQTAFIGLGQGAQGPLRGVIQDITGQIDKLAKNGSFERWGNQAARTLQAFIREATPFAKALGTVLKGSAVAAKGLATAFNALPKDVRTLLVGGSVAGLAAKKFGLPGIAGKAVEKAVGGGVQKVFVVNPGFGKAVPGGGKTSLGSKIATGVGAAGGATAAGVFGGIAVTLGLAATAAYKWSKHVEKTSGVKINPSSDNPARMTERTLTPKFSSDPKGAQAVNDLLDKMKGLAGKAVTFGVTAKVQGADKLTTLTVATKAIRNKAVTVAAAVTGLGPVGLLKLGIEKIKGKAVKAIANVVGSGAVQTLAGKIKNLKGKAVKAIANVVGSGAVQTLAGKIKNLKGKAVKTLSTVVGTPLVAGLISKIKSLRGKSVKTLSTVAGTALVKGLDLAIGSVKGKAVKVAASAAGTGAVLGLASAIGAVRSKTVSIVTKVSKIFSATGGLVSPGGVSHFDRGGPVWGAGSATSDSIDAKLSNGEYVHRTAAVNKYGVDFMQRVNQLQFPAELATYARGGSVPSHSSLPPGARGGDEAWRGGPWAGIARKAPKGSKDSAYVTRAEWRMGVKEFNLAAGLSGKELRAEFKALRKEFNLGGKAFRALQKRAYAVSRQYERNEKALEKSRERLSNLRSAKAEYSSAVTGAYSHERFGNGAAGLKMSLEADRNDAQRALALSKQLDKKGISQGLQKDLLASGDLTTLQQLAGMSKAEIDKYDKLYAQTQAATGDLGKYAAADQYNKQIAAAEKTNRELVRELRQNRRTMERLENAVERGARKGVGDQNRRTAARVRAGGK